MKYLATWILFVLSQGCHGQDGQLIDHTEWVLGTWELTTKKGKVYESWQKSSETQMDATSYLLKDRDSVVLETIKIIEDAGNLYYIPTVNGQNDGAAIIFRLRELTPSSFQFENLEHDSPNVIFYQQKSSHKLTAEIWNYEEGDTTKKEFHMTKLR